MRRVSSFWRSGATKVYSLVISRSRWPARELARASTRQEDARIAAGFPMGNSVHSSRNPCALDARIAIAWPSGHDDHRTHSLVSDASAVLRMVIGIVGIRKQGNDM